MLVALSKSTAAFNAAPPIAAMLVAIAAPAAAKAFVTPIIFVPTLSSPDDTFPKALPTLSKALTFFVDSSISWLTLMSWASVFFMAVAFLRNWSSNF
ncbi:hypothetical protein LHV56_19180 [Peribacillus frigoritolerans]|uniref:hypothetical protein n=1 Tax=Peribacillus frigoritolerans TaxID=450367 RepID=UPI002079B061|nr:hypothetical protein [Peribacillus frigoritolerans]USK83135.1 hypothetical protein LHV56_19180 [Peribacillus frigoritolerans]